MANHYDFAGRVALVTGGASGIGAATVERLRAGGADVRVFDLAN
ncbi:MAG: 3-oxoacyl-ACP reductase, partial [Actinobacteria bacterium]|nr:3-oxoacyl-ACP reductase [Actinomycetota bacterium]